MAAPAYVTPHSPVPHSIPSYRPPRAQSPPAATSPAPIARATRSPRGTQTRTSAASRTASELPLARDHPARPPLADTQVMSALEEDLEARHRASLRPTLSAQILIRPCLSPSHPHAPPSGTHLAWDGVCTTPSGHGRSLQPGARAAGPSPALSGHDDDHAHAQTRPTPFSSQPRHVLLPPPLPKTSKYPAGDPTENARAQPPLRPHGFARGGLMTGRRRLWPSMFGVAASFEVRVA
ncbi:hypothetical protein BD413DRAFT_504479 [Trametes elegans]|nr:hypothetical protein BD413DRAFT_504479 [Trametes elegans]